MKFAVAFGFFGIFRYFFGLINDIIIYNQRKPLNYNPFNQSKWARIEKPKKTENKVANLKFSIVFSFLGLQPYPLPLLIHKHNIAQDQLISVNKLRFTARLSYLLIQAYS